MKPHTIAEYRKWNQDLLTQAARQAARIVELIDERERLQADLIFWRTLAVDLHQVSVRVRTPLKAL